MLKHIFLNEIGDHKGAFSTVVKNGFEAYYKRHPEHAATHSKRSRACLIHDYMVEAAVGELPPDEFRLVTSRQRNLFNFREVSLIQFKKLGHNLAPSNIRTGQSELFDIFGEVDGLPGIAGSLPLITIGYVPKPYFSGVEGVFATHIVNRKPEWFSRLDDDDTSSQQTMTSLVTPPNDHARQSPPTRIKNRRPDDLGEQSGNS